MASATDKQVSYVLGLLRQAGLSEQEHVDVQTSRKWGLPVGDTVRNTIKALTVSECSALIERLKD